MKTMDKIKKLLESIDAKVLTEEVKTSLVEAFNKSVESKADELAKDKFNSLEEEYAKSIDEMIETATKTIKIEMQDELTEKAEAKAKEISDEYVKNLQEEAEAKLNEEIDSLKESFNKYIQYGAQSFIDENEAKWLQESEVKKANDIQESFVRLATGFGVELTSITEGEDETKVELNKAIDTNAKLVEEVKRLNKEIMIENACKDLTSPQADRFMKLMEEVSFSDEKQFSDKIDLYKSAVSMKKESNKVIDDDTNDAYTPSWKK
jgi:hypothetical protein